MKHIWISLILIILALMGILYGFRQPQETAEEDEDLIVIGMSQVGAESDWRVANSESMKQVFSEENGYRLLFEEARQKQENQFSSIRRFIQQQVDYIVVMPITETGWESVLQEAKEAGIPVIAADRKMNVEDPSLITAHVGSDIYAEGRKAVTWMEENFKDQPQVNIIHIQGTLDSTAQIGRTQALENGLAANPNWNLLSRMQGDFTQAKTFEVMTEYLQSSDSLPVIDVVYCENDNEAFGAVEALESFGYRCGPGGVAVISFDATREALQYCRDGKIALEVECNPLLGPLVEEVIQILESGQELPKTSYATKEAVFTPKDITEELLEQRPY